ncbi:hypothetical protein ACFFP0_10220 [Rhizobium puerariae]|uniref:Ornithine cyclodeaminase family protein n=1 Tax=Rhizobium puerariae TaxID=1585791 RepID=A0ABV6AIQ4_9HYPH
MTGSRQNRQEFLYLSSADIAALAIGAGAIADEIARASRARAAGRVQIPPKIILRQENGAAFYAMTALAEGDGSVMKWLGNPSRNDAAGLPSFMGFMVVSDPKTGVPAALLSASDITAMRTAATSLLAARHLARQDAAVLGLAGCGAQARAHLTAIAREFPIRRVLLLGRSQTGIETMQELARTLGLAAEKVDGPEELIAQSDIVVSSVPPDAIAAPFLDARRLPAGAFVSMVDHGHSWTIEGLAPLGSLFTDDLAATADRALVDPHLKRIPVSGDLTQIGGGFRRQSVDQRIGFVFAGTALADLAAANVIVRAARERGLGTALAL